MVAVEPHHADPVLQEAPSKRVPWSLMKEMTYQKDTTATRGVVVIAMVEET